MGFVSDILKSRKRGPAEPDDTGPVPIAVAALDAVLRLCEGVQRDRDESGELVLCTERPPHHIETLLSRFITFRRRTHRVVLDACGEFMIEEALKPGRKLRDVPPLLAARFGLSDRVARDGMLALVKSLMARRFVRLYRE